MHCRCLVSSDSEKDLWGFTFSSLTLTFLSLALALLSLRVFKHYGSEPCPHVSEPCSHVFEPLSLSLTPSNIVLSSCSSDLTLSGLILSALYTSSTLILLHQILVCGTLILSQSCQCDAFRSKLVGGPTKTMLVTQVGLQAYRKKTPMGSHIIKIFLTRLKSSKPS